MRLIVIAFSIFVGSLFYSDNQCSTGQKDLIEIFEREVKGSERIMILLTAIGYQGHLDVDRNLIKRAVG